MEETVAFDSPENQAITHIFNTILLYAQRDGASEIMIEPQLVADGIPNLLVEIASQATMEPQHQKRVTIFYKINNEKRDVMAVPFFILKPLAAYIRTMAGMEPSDSDGLFQVTIKNTNYEWYVITTPSADGVKIHLRRKTSV